jgi:hypothetical protein
MLLYAANDLGEGWRGLAAPGAPGGLGATRLSAFVDSHWALELNAELERPIFG